MINKTNCVIVEVSEFEWIYFFAGMTWWLMGFYCMKCGDILRRSREREEAEIITATPINPTPINPTEMRGIQSTN